MTNEQDTTPPASDEPVKPIATTSAVLKDGTLAELVYDSDARRTRFAVWKGQTWQLQDNITFDDGGRLIPYGANNSLIQHEVVLLPSKPVEYGTQADLLADIQAYIHRYVDISPRFERIASTYAVSYTHLTLPTILRV